MYLGIDLAKATFTITALRTPQDVRVYGLTLPNAPGGFAELLTHITPETVVVMESTGVYGDKLRHFLHAHGVTQAVEPAIFIRRAFRLKAKTDPVDSRMIAEYGYRYADQLHFWTPKPELVEQAAAYLVSRELLVKQKTAHRNIERSLAHKARPLTHSHTDIIEVLNAHIEDIETALADIFRPHETLRAHLHNLNTLPGCGTLFAYNFFVLSDGFERLDFRSLGNYLGIVPHEYSSGERIFRRPKTDHKGPERIRKVLYLCAMASIRRTGRLQTYFARKRAEGKEGKLILNNLMNKLLKMACAVVRDGQPYADGHKPVNPNIK